MSTTPSEVFNSIRLTADVLERIHQELLVQGGTDEDFMVLMRPNRSGKLISKMAECLLPSSVERLLRQWSAVPIEELELTTRSYNCLKWKRFEFVSELLTCTEYDLLEIPYFGQACLRNVKQALEQKGLQLAE